MDWDCLDNTIGLRQACGGGTTPAPKFGLYLDDLPGFAFCAMSDILDPAKYAGAVDFVNAKAKAAAIQVLEQYVPEAVEPFIVAKDDLDFGYLGTLDPDSLSLAGTADPRGLRLKKRPGLLSKLLVSKVTVRSATSGTFTLQIVDGDTTSEHSITLVADVALDVWLHYEAKNDQVDILIEDASFHPYSGDMTRFMSFRSCGTCSSGGAYELMSGTGLLSGTETAATQGIIAQTGVTCSLNYGTCLIASRLKVPILYATAIEVLADWEATPRLNYFAHHAREWAEKERIHYTETKLPAALKSHLKGLAYFLQRMDAVCIDCGTGVSMAWSHG